MCQTNGRIFSRFGKKFRRGEKRAARSVCTEYGGKRRNKNQTANMAAADTMPMNGYSEPAAAGRKNTVSKAGRMAAGKTVRPTAKPSAAATTQHPQRGILFPP